MHHVDKELIVIHMILCIVLSSSCITLALHNYALGKVQIDLIE